MNSSYRKGITIGFVGVYIFSFDSVLIHASNGGGFQAAFFRGLFMGVSLLAVYLFKCLRNGKNPWKEFIGGGSPMWISGVCWTFSGLVFTLGIQLGASTVTLVMLSMGPLFTSLFSWLWIHEKPSPVTLAACFIAVAGVVVMYVDSFASVPLEGLILALILPVIIGFNMANLRRSPETDRLPICMIGGFGSALVALAFCLAGGNLVSQGMKIWPLALLGLLVLPIGQVMVSSSSIYLTATQSALINSLESIWGILHFYALFHDVPDRNTLIGAIVVFAAIVANAALVPVYRKIKEKKA
ncbi:MAG: DMT family transporter [Sphaerochaetaceae bacterium]|nr:DMT family transporter [Sphaerochaetaceae bacterium]MDD4007220.1 DMT family transporter [Sphaerochaetaceae bacterium]